ncbi:hypothetical protein Misp01_78730 [Microtetraspora sp. NBRC 13810]|uniref:hypothetical protein n=1 Tax=Microtetraspora sp. NBRC 13810 TaxID=3030990 RepID=UPI0024A068B8|nr:hypothetical protein [Microtetraspora sp. NBRC 13810]GLW12745.1 hypothetical protein Misp01_78730 [Microtetraspora sp. NBRC 13810]
MPIQRLAFVAPLDEDDDVEWDADGGWCHVVAGHPFVAFAAEQGWESMPLPESYEDGDRAVCAWRTADGTLVRLTLDTVIAVTLVELQGDSTTATEAMIRSVWECRTCAEALSMLALVSTLGTAQARRELRSLAATGPADPDPRVVRAVEAAVHDARPAVRSEAMTVVRYLKWQEFRPSVEHLVRVEADDAVGSNTRFLLDMMRQAAGT